MLGAGGALQSVGSRVTIARVAGDSDESTPDDTQAELEALRARLQEVSDTDAITGLASARRFEIDAERELARASRYGGGALLVLGLDNFKHVNEARGYRAGDEVLREIAALLLERLREIDIASRHGGDRYAIVLTEVTVERARSIGEELSRLIAERPFEIEGKPISIRVSGGVVGLAEGPADVAEAMRWAEVAMARAKAMGGDRVIAFDPADLPDHVPALTWSERIRAALETDRFVQHYQPILELSSGSVSSWELLIRMQGEGGEMIQPNSFIPTAERFGLIKDLDRWVVRSAVAAMAAHTGDEDPFRLEINLSGQSIGDPVMLEEITKEISSADLDPRRLVFEVTETAAIANLEQAARFGRALIDLGCGFALDDFGTGFASFYYLKRLPLTHLKIDGDFVRGISSSSVDQLVVQAIVQIAEGMGLETIAEYVEDAETLELLRDLGVDYCQGFEIGRPEPPPPPDLGPPAARA
jgi:diguanylate cyclase (GGDEF)-like protein